MEAITLDSIEKRIQKVMKKEDKTDAEFRFIIAATEFADIGKYITHDPIINPNARPHGTKEDETLAFGQALVQIIALTQLRNIQVKDAFEEGLKNWEAADWKKTEAKYKNKIIGITACPGYIEGLAYIAFKESDMKQIPEGSILVTKFASPEIAAYLKQVSACVTDHGGKTCHLANIIREYNIPCIVGTGNATELIKQGQRIIVNATEDEGKVTILE